MERDALGTGVTQVVTITGKNAYFSPLYPAETYDWQQCFLSPSPLPLPLATGIKGLLAINALTFF